MNPFLALQQLILGPDSQVGRSRGTWVCVGVCTGCYSSTKKGHQPAQPQLVERLRFRRGEKIYVCVSLRVVCLL